MDLSSALKRDEALSQFSYCLSIEPTNVECIREEIERDIGSGAIPFRHDYG